MELTKKQKRLILYLIDHPNATFAEIQRRFRYKSPNAVTWAVKQLILAGVLERVEPNVRWKVLVDRTE